MKIGSDDGFKNLEVFVYNSQQLDVVGGGNQRWESSFEYEL